MPEQFYKNLTSRNYLYISPSLQDKIQAARLAFFGTGLSSNIAEHCARIGFMHMHLNDGDKVEISNLNRQAFTLADIESGKASVLKKRILAINPHCRISSSEKYIQNMSDAAAIVDNSDIIVNTIDCTRVYFDLIDYARQKNKLVLCPFNPGFSGMLLAFTADSASPHDIFDTRDDSKLNDHAVAGQLFENFPEIRAPQQASLSADAFLRQVAVNGYFPQINIGALLTTALTLTTIVKYLKNEAIKLAPGISCLDSYYSGS